METGAVDAPLTRRPTLASSWDAACGALAQSLRLARAGLGARDADWEQLLAPPATGQDLVILKRSLHRQGENPCFLHVRCDPRGGEEMVSVGVLSSARNMEVYLGEEYCGTSRGKSVCNVLDNRATPAACGSSLARGRIGTTPAGLQHRAAAVCDLSLDCDLHHSHSNAGSFTH